MKDSEHDISEFDKRMALPTGEDANGLRWIDGRDLPLEGKAYEDTELYYDRLPSNVTEAVNAGVRIQQHHSTGMLFRFSTDSKKLEFRWTTWSRNLAMDHMPASGVSGIDIYHRAPGGEWKYLATGRITDPEKGSCSIAWTPGEECIVNLPLYNGIKSFALGVEPDAKVSALPPRGTKPVVFYGTSITHGGCCSRPGLSFVNRIGRDLDIHVVNLGFSGSGRMEFELAGHIARIDASCYVLDTLWNMDEALMKERYEPFIRDLRARRPDTPIVMAGRCDVFCNGPVFHDEFIEDLYKRLTAEGWKKLYLLPKDGMLGDDGEGTVDGVHPNDIGMAHMAKVYGAFIKRVLADR